MKNILIAKNIDNKIVEFGIKVGVDFYIHVALKQLTEIIHIPNELEALYCYNNILTSLPKLSKSLKVLECENNNIKKLPNLRNFKKLIYLDCDIQCFESYMLEMNNTDFNFYC